MSISNKVRQMARRDGLRALPARTILFLLRRVAWRAEGWSKRLDFSTQAKTLLREHGHLLARNEAFRNKHEGQRCFIIGNGPSLNEQDISPLRDEVTFVTNAFCRHPVVDQWSPTYYFITDPLYFDGSEKSRDWLLEIKRRVPSTTFFVPHSAEKTLSTDQLLPLDRTYYVAVCGGDEERWLVKPDLTNVIPPMQTVVQLSIMAAMFMGCSPIYLLGLDHDWLCNPYANFYKKEDTDTYKWSYKSLMEAVLLIWQIYEMLHRIAEAEGISIFNATRGGFLDVFERIEYESVIHKP